MNFLNNSSEATRGLNRRDSTIGEVLKAATVNSQTKDFFCFAKSVIVSIWFNAWERTPRWLKGSPVVSGRGSGKSQIPGGCGGAYPRPPIMLEGEPFKEILSQHSLWRLIRLLPIFLMSFTCSSRNWFSRKSQR